MDKNFPENLRVSGTVAQTDYIEFSIWVSSDKSGSNKGLCDWRPVLFGVLSN